MSKKVYESPEVEVIVYLVEGSSMSIDILSITGSDNAIGYGGIAANDDSSYGDDFFA